MYVGVGISYAIEDIFNLESSQIQVLLEFAYLIPSSSSSGHFESRSQVHSLRKRNCKMGDRWDLSKRDVNNEHLLSPA